MKTYSILIQGYIEVEAKNEDEAYSKALKTLDKRDLEFKAEEKRQEG